MSKLLDDRTPEILAERIKPALRARQILVLALLVGFGAMTALGLYDSEFFSWSNTNRFAGGIAILIAFTALLTTTATAILGGSSPRWKPGSWKRLLIRFGGPSAWFGFCLGLVAPGLAGLPPAWVVWYPNSDYYEESNVLPRVAHAGGAVGNVVSTNSLEALAANSSYFDYFELDFSETSDGHPVCLHDWDAAFSALLGPDSPSNGGPVTLSEFERTIDQSPWTPCTVDSLSGWMQSNPTAIIVTDVKTDDNVATLKKLFTGLPDANRRVIPQVYSADEARVVYEVGFDQTILTLYRDNRTASEIVATLDGLDFFAVTVPKQRAQHLAGPIADTGLYVYAHTVNNYKELAELRSFGVTEIYTDFLRTG